MNTTKDLASTIDPLATRLRGLARRMIASIAGAKAIWQFTGSRQLDGSREVVKAEVFQGVGIYAVPAGTAEAILVMIGDGKTPVAIAVRDEATRQAVAGSLAADETALYNSQALVHVKADGTIEAKSAGGTAVPLATKADLDALRIAINTASIAVGPAGASSVITALDTVGGGPNTWPAGTAVLKGE